ncbi:protein kinase domain-containing protein [Nocardiopsis nanhaiensis]
MQQPAPNDPREVGPYRVVALLGSGGMGRVYLGLGPDGSPAAVKVVRAEYAYDPGFRGRFARELELAQRVHGNYTPRVLTADTSGQTPWLATEYVMGPSLQDLVHDTGPLPEESVRFMARGIAQALERVHATGLVHRDLKPGNVMISAAGPQVIDFGIAHAMGDAQDAGEEDRFVGTPGFMAPETVNGDGNSTPADIFALGGILVHALTGQGPFGDGHPSTVLYRIGNLDPDLAAVPPSLRGIITACLEKNPASRPNAAQVLQALGGPTAPAPAAAAWLPPAASERIDGIAREYGNAVRSATASGGKGSLGGRLLITGAAATALAMVAGLGVWSADQAGLIGGGTETASGDDEPVDRETCDPSEHLAAEFLEAAEDEPTAPNDDEGMFYTAFSNDGEVFVATGTGGAALWDWREQEEIARIPTEIAAGTGHPHFSPDDCLLAYASEDGAHVYHLESGEHTVYSEGYVIDSMAFSDDGAQLILGAGDSALDSSVQIYDLDSGELVNSLTDGSGIVTALDVTPDGAHVAGQGSLDSVFIWNTESGEIVAEGEGSPWLSPTSLHMVDDSNLLMPEVEGAVRQGFGDSDEYIEYRDEDLEEGFEVHDVKYSEEADRVYVTYIPSDFEFEEAYMKVWEYSTGEDLTADTPEGFFHEIAVHPEGEVIMGVPSTGTGMWIIDAAELRLIEQM